MKSVALVSLATTPVGAARPTVPETALVFSAASVLVAETLPENAPVAAPVRRTYTVVSLTVPPLGVNETELPYPDPLERDTL